MLNKTKTNVFEDWFSNPRKDILSGLVVAFAMIPEAIAFSGIAGVDPQVGLFGAFCLSITIAIVGGRMGMITSATGSTALLMTGVVATGNAQGGGTWLVLSYCCWVVNRCISNPLGVFASCLSNEVCSDRGIKWFC